MIDWLKSKFQSQEEAEEEAFVKSVVSGVQDFVDEVQSEGGQAEATFYCGRCGFLPMSQYPHDCRQ
jgi:hypothetical protein